MSVSVHDPNFMLDLSLDLFCDGGKLLTCENSDGPVPICVLINVICDLT